MTIKFYIDNLHVLFPDIGYIYYEPIHDVLMSIEDPMNIESVKTILTESIWRLCEKDIEITNTQMLCYLLWWMRTYVLDRVEFREECLRRQEWQDRDRVLNKLVAVLKR